jgi:ATP-binding cassette, subfamily F, member 3
MLTVSNLTVRFRGASAPLFSNVSFIVNKQDRIGLFGANGVGKTTLLQVVLGQRDAQAGSVTFTPPDLRIGYLSQGIDTHRTAEEILFPHHHELQAAEQALETLGDQMAGADEVTLNTLMQQYDDALATIERLSSLQNESHAEQLLKVFDLEHIGLQTPVGVLSGGQKTRLRLASVLLHDPQLLLLDEPTNHLDIAAIEWLESWLQDFQGGVLMVSHDRTFMDRTVNQIIALRDGTARSYPGNYRDYTAAVQSELDKQWAQWQDQQVEIARMQADISFTMAKAVRKENATKNDQQRRYAKKVAKRAQSKVTRLKRYIASDDRVEKPQQHWHLKLDFAELPGTGKDVIHTENLSVGYEQAALLSELDLSVRAGERIAILGPNGHGKSTLLKTIIGELAPVGGTVRLGASIQVGYLAQEQDILQPGETPLQVIQSVSKMNQTEARSFLHFFLFAGDDALRPVEMLSFGERARLMLARLIAQGANLLVLDEPINHLDVQSREQFEQALENFPGSVLAVVHDRYFVERFAHTIWHIENSTLEIRVQVPLTER